MNEERAKRKLSALLSADVKGYSRLMGEDELGTIETLKKYRKIITSLIDQFRGRVVDSPGDNILSEFGSVVDAVQCAVKIQEELKGENAEYPESRRMEFRIGVNLGDVVEDGERIYGDGVNIAARIEGLADGGGICISRTAFDQVKNKISTGYEYLGEHSVKNIKDPVGVYRLQPEAEVKGSVVYKRRRDDPRHRRRASLIALSVLVVAVVAFVAWNFYFRGPAIAPASVDRMAFPLPDKPSIAVLPFTNMSGDPEQDYIGDGLSENIISALCVSSKIFVIARNTTFTYKGKAVDIKKVAEDLGVQYVLEGSIQKSGDRLRVTAQLIDALTGHHLWSEKYDREMQELFDLQDEITKKVVVSLQVELIEGDGIRVFAKSTENLDAWIHWIKGDNLLLKFDSPGNVAKAREHFKAAVELDPEFVGALISLAVTHFRDSILRWSDSPSMSMKRAFELAQKALKLDEQNASAHALLGQIYLGQRQYEKAIASGKRAIIIDPNFAMGHRRLATIMFCSGQFDEAVTLYEKALRLNPKLLERDPTVLGDLLRSYLFLGRYEEALEVNNQIREFALRDKLPGWYSTLCFSYIYQKLGREEEARAYMAETLKLNPNLSIETLHKPLFKNPDHLQQELDALLEAGMPEKSPGAIQ